MMNAGIIPPDDGYLAGAARPAARRGRALDLRRGQDRLHHRPRRAPPGCYGVTPDIVCLAKALGGGIPVAAIGGTEEVMSAIADGRYEQVGTFNGNPLAMAAARATLTEVLDDAGVRPPRRARGAGCAAAARRVIAANGLPWHVVTVGAKGCVTFPGPGPQLPRLPGDRRPAGPPALARAAQRRRVPAAVGQGRAVAAVGAAHRRRRRPVRRQLRHARRAVTG